MKYNPLEARCVFIDGPVAVYVHEAPKQVILDAYANLKGVVEIAATQLGGGSAEPFNVEHYIYSTCTQSWDCGLCRLPYSERTLDMSHKGEVL